MQPGAADFHEPVRGWRIWTRAARQHLDRQGTGWTARPARAFAPDYVTPIVGWRTWRVVRRNGRLLLASPVVNVAWRPGSPLVAECHVDPIEAEHEHETPEPACACGIHAWRLEALEWPAFVRAARRPLVVGRVLLWGKVVEGTNGWRAEVAYPERLWVPATDGRYTAGVWQIADGLAEYGVDVSPVCVDGPRALATMLRVLDDELRAA
jgi:hypothetical protein